MHTLMLTNTPSPRCTTRSPAYNYRSLAYNPDYSAFYSRSSSYNPHSQAYYSINTHPLTFQTLLAQSTLSLLVAILKTCPRLKSTRGGGGGWIGVYRVLGWNHNNSLNMMAQSRTHHPPQDTTRPNGPQPYLSLVQVSTARKIFHIVRAWQP
jgi:hypothetical protein